jgi:hypothetical protein
MIRHTLLPRYGPPSAIHDDGSSGHITRNAPTADITRGPGRPPHHC